MKMLKLVIVLGSSFVTINVEESQVAEINAQIKKSIEEKSLFTLGEMICARGIAIAGWYYSPAVPSAADRVADVLEKTSTEGEGWRG